LLLRGVIALRNRPLQIGYLAQFRRSIGAYWLRALCGGRAIFVRPRVRQLNAIAPEFTEAVFLPGKSTLFSFRFDARLLGKKGS
jgi:hypothetical protein